MTWFEIWSTVATWSTVWLVFKIVVFFFAFVFFCHGPLVWMGFLFSIEDGKGKTIYSKDRIWAIKITYYGRYLNENGNVVEDEKNNFLKPFMWFKNYFFGSLHILGIPGIHNVDSETYDWEKPLVDYQDSVNDKVIIKENYAVEYAFDGDYFYEYRLKHVIEYINSDEQIELSNKKYITLYTNNELLSAKVRVIKRDGKIIEMGKDKVLSSSDETTGQISHYFALEGLEKGCIVEYMYTIRKYPQYNGIIRYIQESDSIISYQFHLMSPKHLIFDFAVYNDTNQVVIDTTETEKNHWKLNINQISALNDEPQAPYNKLLKQVWYKLDRNLAKGTKDISSYGDASQNIYRQMFDLGNKKEQQALHKFLSS